MFERPSLSHAYVPGLTPRHAEGAFDALHASVEAGMSVEALGRSASLQAGLYYFRHGYFWEAHEALEPVWMSLPKGPDRERVQALIQLANAALKLRMGRERATQRLCERVHKHLNASCGSVLPISADWLTAECALLGHCQEPQ